MFKDVINLNTKILKDEGFFLAKLPGDPSCRSVYIKKGFNDIYITEKRGGNFVYYGKSASVVPTTLDKVYPKATSWPCREVSINELVPL